MADTGKRGISVEIVGTGGEAESSTIDLYDSSYALVIGIDSYTGGWPDLKNAVADARAVADSLRQRGFGVDYHENPGSDELRQLFRRFFIERGANPGSRLFVWFAGHGHTLDGEGFLIPADGAVPVDDTAFRRTALHLRDIGNFARLARSRHSFVVFDSCFAGTVFGASRSLPPPAIRHAVLNPVRQFLTSGSADQQVSDDGLFRRLFLEALDGKRSADANGDGYLTATEIGLFMGDAISNYTINSQTPQFGPLRDPLYDKGDFVFLLKQPASGRVLSASVDAVVWNSIRNSQRPEDFELFISTYPQSPFLPFAASRLAALAVGPAVDVEVLDETYFVSAERVNLRKQPSIESERVGQLVRGDSLQVTGAVTNAPWYRLQATDGATAFIRRDLVSTVRVAPRTTAPSGQLLTPGAVFSDCPECPSMVVVSSGSFLYSADNGQTRAFELPEPFAIGEFEMTEADWQACVADGDCGGYQPNENLDPPGRSAVSNVSWNDAMAYVRWLSKRTGKFYRLPSDAEWEYVANRSGEMQLDVPDQTRKHVVADEQHVGILLQAVDLRKTESATAQGLIGGLREWVADCRIGQETRRCAAHAVRGTATRENERGDEDLPRVWVEPQTRSPVIGFRVARDLSEKELGL